MAYTVNRPHITYKEDCSSPVHVTTALVYGYICARCEDSFFMDITGGPASACLQCMLTDEGMVESHTKIVSQLAYPKRYNHILGEELADFEVHNHYLRLWQTGWHPVEAGSVSDQCLKVLAQQQDKGKAKFSPLQHVPMLYRDWIDYTYGKLKATRDGKIWSYPEPKYQSFNSFQLGSTKVRLHWGLPIKLIELSLPVKEFPKCVYRLYEEDWCILRVAIPHVQSLMENSSKDEVVINLCFRLAKFRIDESMNVHMTLENVTMTRVDQVGPQVSQWAIASTIIPQLDWVCLVWNHAVFDNYFAPPR